MKSLVEAKVGKKLTPAALASELLRLGLQPVATGSGNKNSTPGHDDEDAGNGCLSANFITVALTCHKWICSSSACVELLMDLEAHYGSKSPFHRMTTLSCLASKPASAKSRQWVLCSICDWIGAGLLKCSEITKSTLSGDKHHTGLISLFETKAKVSRPFFVLNICHCK